MGTTKNAWISLAVACALVIGVYAYVVQPGAFKPGRSNAADDYYNLLVQGFRAGQLSLKKEVPPGFAQLADPYDPATNRLYWGLPYGIGDLSYYKGRLYLYFGVTPALILFWPVVALTGHYLFYGQAVTIFCAAGFLASMGILVGLWRRYFAEVSVWVVAACAVALALATGVPLLLERCEVYEVAISCGYMLTMLALGAIWCALHEREKGWRWLAAASMAYGLALGARPSLLFGAIILMAPVGQARQERRQVWPMLATATVPITLIGLGLMLYNELRFGNPFEFGWHYQLAGERHVTRQFFNPHYLWFNFRVYLLKPARWSSRFPFVREIALPPVPAGYGGIESPFGVLTNIPLVWLALAVPLAWRGRSGQAASVLRWFGAAVALLFGTCVLPVLFFISAVSRYEVEFLPALLLLAVVGILSLERALSDRPVWRRAARCGWSLLLACSVAFNLLASVKRRAEAHNDWGIALLEAGQMQEAMEQYEQALRLNPDYAEAHCNLGTVFLQMGKVSDAIGHYEQALQIKPDYAEAHNNLGIALAQTGKIEEAIAHFEQALRIKPDYADAHKNLGLTLEKTGKIEEAIAHFDQALRIMPDSAEAHDGYGVDLQELGRVPEAMEQYEQALRIKPDDADAHLNLGTALEKLGREADAIRHYEEALRIKPDSAKAHYNLGSALAQEGRGPEAIAQYQQALRIEPDFADVHNNLGIALAQSGRIPEAIEHWEEALRLRPDDAATHYNLGNALQGQGRVPEAIEQFEQALKLRPDFTPAKNALARLQARQ